jgi:SSS family transporter
MNPTTILLIIALYFGALLLISYFTGKEDNNEAFFKANKQSPWYVVAFGMIGATLSGVTFISVPGMIAGQQFAYMQGVFGFFVGTFFIILVLLPLYYRLNVTSIYQYLEQRFGVVSYKTGAFFFLLSRVTGASFRLFLVAISMQYIVFQQLGVPFWMTVVISILLIWVYTFRGGIKTIVWTDTLQTFAMLTSVGVAIYLILQKLDWSYLEFLQSTEFASKSKIFFFEDPNSKIYFWKYFIGGIFIAITMTGLDQDMMQKNLTCKTQKEAQKNMSTMIFLLLFVNFVFLSLGALLFIYAEKFGVAIPELAGKQKTDLLFPEIAMNQGLGIPLAITFIIGLIAAAYSSADSALTSLTTSVSVDFFNIENKPKSEQKPLRKKIHIAVSVLLIFVVIGFKQLDDSVVNNLFRIASFTYGPLLGLFAFGILTKRKLNDKYAWLVCLIAIILIIVIAKLPKSVIGDYNFSWEILPINGLITFIGLWLISKKG